MIWVKVMITKGIESIVFKSKIDVGLNFSFFNFLIE